MQDFMRISMPKLYSMKLFYKCEKGVTDHIDITNDKSKAADRKILYWCQDA